MHKNNYLNDKQFMDQFKFDTSYNQYWKDRVKHASDGTKVPGLEVIEEACCRAEDIL